MKVGLQKANKQNWWWLLDAEPEVAAVSFVKPFFGTLESTINQSDWELKPCKMLHLKGCEIRHPVCDAREIHPQSLFILNKIIKEKQNLALCVMGLKPQKLTF